MIDALRRLGRLGRSLYARIALVYLASLLLLSLVAAWLAISQFDRLGREVQQRNQIDLAEKLVRIMRAPVAQGPDTDAAHEAAQLILSINPSLSLYVLDSKGGVMGHYDDNSCGTNAQVNVAALESLLRAQPMLPEFIAAPCSGQRSVFSVARIRYGTQNRPGYLLAVFDDGPRMSMFSMLRTSSITRTSMFAGVLALLISSAVGLLLFALLTRRFSSLTHVVQRFADGDYGQRVVPGQDDEIGQLGRAFNDMAGTIEAQLNALRENDRQRRDLVANLSHDFRTPLTSLRGYAEQLRSADDLSAETRRAHLDAILANTERLTRLAQQLSTLSRLDAGAEQLRIEPFSLAELVHDIVGKFQPQARSARVELRLRNLSDLPRVLADLALIDRALTNLIDNALCATPEGGEVRVSAYRDGDKVMVCVADTGVGMRSEELPLVTQRFYRTATSRTASDGSGLGLSIVAEICERHDSRLVLRSTAGKGTRAQFGLPIA